MRSCRRGRFGVCGDRVQQPQIIARLSVSAARVCSVSRSSRVRWSCSITQDVTGSPYRFASRRSTRRRSKWSGAGRSPSRTLSARSVSAASPRLGSYSRPQGKRRGRSFPATRSSRARASAGLSPSCQPA